MHDIDRIQLEVDGFETDGFEMNSFEFEPEYTDMEVPFNEVEEMELAADFLEIADDRELDQFLGNIMKKAGRFMSSPAGRALGGMLKGVAKKALPIVGGAIGNMVVPGVGGMIGSKLASSAGSLFGLELEGLSPEDREFEVARRFVRFAGAAAKNAAAAPQNASPAAVAKSAIVSSAKKYAPGILRSVADTMSGGPSAVQSVPVQTGRWVRKGRRVILYGVF